MTFYRRNLPHWQPWGAVYFITFRLAGSLPKQAIEKIKQEQKLMLKKVGSTPRSSDSLSELRGVIHKKIFKKYESLIDKGETGPKFLAMKEVAEIVKSSIHYRDEKEYQLYAYYIMPNHVHLVCKLNSTETKMSSNVSEYPLTKMLKSIKWFTALEANKVLNRTGQAFWQAESYDHVVRDSDELERIILHTE